jgi:ABC-2 type transport system permease protein
VTGAGGAQIGAPLRVPLRRAWFARRHLSLLAGYAGRSFAAAFAWRAFLLTLVVQAAVPPLLGLAVWTQALPDQPAVAAYFAALLFVRMLTVSYEPYTFLNDIYNGALTDRLLRPRPVVLEPLGSSLAWRAWHALLVLPLLVAVGTLTSVRVSGADVALAVPAVLLAAALRFLFSYILVLAAFWTQRAGALAAAGAQLVFLLGGEAAPVPLLPAPQQAWVAALPFRAMIGFPAEVAAGLTRGEAVVAGYAWQLLWLAVLTLLAVLVWRTGLRRYTAVGG